MNTFAMPAPATPRRRWYHEPMMWLVVGGPLVVVVAALITVFIAMKHADPVLPRQAPAVRVDPAALQQLSPEERAAAELSVMPAGKARNHVMSPNPPREP